MNSEDRREHRRRRMRRHGRRAYIRSVYFLPSLATLGNAICGFGAMYIAGLDYKYLSNTEQHTLTGFMSLHRFTIAAYLIFLAMIFDALDGRLARFARHTTDFGGQLDSLADVISFGAAPAFIALRLFRSTIGESEHFPVMLSRLIWSIGALYMCCAAMRLARFNVSNEHGEQHHFSFLGLPSPGAGGAVAAFIMMQQDLHRNALARQLAMGGDLNEANLLGTLSTICLWILPFLILVTGLLMVSNVRYPHVVNKYLRGKRSMARLVVMLGLFLLLIVAHEYTLGIGTFAYALSGPLSWAYLRIRRKASPPSGPTTNLPQSGPAA